MTERLTTRSWRNLDPWECCGQDKYCQRGCHETGGCAKGCIVPKLYVRLAKYEDAMEKTPTIDDEPVRHGHWVLEREPNGKPYCFHCSVCDDDFHYIGIMSATNYCPNCGAKMEEVSE